ncbi:hypothetical protein M23134_00041 [Microscilla marina ATCC 23134]|uniref:Uncharacterized protein n=1 Tax=Microscilla marina ATCC 23134 TaxID=313606 RepID=A1ZKS1_MICM2|nr:hypothetical protein M23134_00041 [Microscilla marina ATCC 23134]
MCYVGIKKIGVRIRVRNNPIFCNRYWLIQKKAKIFDNRSKKGRRQAFIFKNLPFVTNQHPPLAAL